MPAKKPIFLYFVSVTFPVKFMLWKVLHTEIIMRCARVAAP
jgi:hypothetical protein